MKRLLAMLLVLAMVLSVAPASVLAEAVHENGHVCRDESCKDAAITWQPWTGTEKNGHYYLTGDVTITSPVVVSGTNSLHLCLNGYSVKGNKTARLFGVEGNGQLTISDCTTVLDENGRFMSGGRLYQGFNGTCGGAIYAKGSAQVTLIGIKLEDNSCSATSTGGWTGGAVHVRETSRFTAVSCLFTDNTAQEGAAILARAGATVSCTDCVFTGNIAAGGGGAVFATNSTVTLDDCLVEGNKSNGNGGSALHIANATVFTIKDTTITGNISTAGNAWKGALYQDNAASRFVLTGKVIIDDNFVDNGTTERNVLFAFTGSKLGIDKLGAGSKVSILTMNWNSGKDYEYTSVTELLELSGETDQTAWDPAWIYYEDNESYVYYDSFAQQLRFTKDPSHYHCLCGGEEDGCDHGKQIWIPWNDNKTLPVDSGYYYLTCDVSLATGATVSTNDQIHLCLNGFTVTADHETQGKVEDQAIYMTRNGQLTISDCTAATVDGVYTAGKLTGGSKGVISLNKLGENATENVLTIYDGILTGNTNTTDGGAVNITAGSGKFYFYGGQILGNTAEGAGGAINAAKGSLVEIHGGVICDNTSKKNGGAINAIEATVTITGGEFSGNTGENGGAVYANAATVTIEDGKFAENTAITAGGVAAFSNGSQVTVSGGEYTQNTAPNGGALCIMSQSGVTVSDGTFAENTVTANGGALYLSYNAALTVTGGKLENNTAAVHGAAIFADRDSQLTILGGLITGNQSGTGAVSIHENITAFTLGGQPEILGNQAGSVKGNLHLRGNATMQIRNLNENAKIGITADNLPRFISENEANETCFTPDMAYRMITIQEGKLYIDYSDEHQHCLCGGNDTGCDHANAKWAAWEATDALPTESGYYYLLNDVVLPNAAILKNDADVKLCLNGHTITAAHETELAENDRAFILRNNAKLTISDCTAATIDGKYTAGKLTGGSRGVVNLAVDASAVFTLYDGILTGNNRADNVGGAVTLLNTPDGSNVFNMYGGEISSNWAKGDGGAVYVKEGCTFNLYGGTITGNKSTTFHGGGVAVVKDGTLNLYGGTISGNNASKNGGGIFVQEGSLNIYGGSVKGNYAGSNGGGISAISGKITINGGAVTGNTAKAAGGALSVSTKTRLKISGGNLDYNTANDGGAICVMSDSVITITGGSIGYNKSIASAGGIYVSRTGTLNMQGGSIHHNSSPRTGGGLFLNNATFNFSGGDISYNTAENGAGGILAGSNSLVEMTGGTVYANESIRGAGTIVQGKATFNMRGGKFEANLAQVEAGGFYISTNSFFTLYDGEVCENVAAYRGGGILANASFTIAGGTVRANKVTGSDAYKNPYAGGVVIIGESDKTLTMTGGTICDNYSAGTGGGMRINYMNTLAMSGGTFRNNVAEKTAGGLEVYGSANITGGEFIGNKAGTVGGGLRVVSQVHLNMENVRFEGNEAVTRGGAVYLAKGNWTTMKDCLFTGNISGEQGSAIYSWDELLLDGCTITGNKAGGVGAVYLCSANFDGQSYVLAVPKIAGNLVIEGNEGPCPGLYIEEGGYMAVGTGGLGENAKVQVYLQAGVLTNTIFGTYDYTGGDLEYLVTYGDRSDREFEHTGKPLPTQPEEEPTQPAETTPPETSQESGDAMLYLAIGGIALVILLAAVLVVVRKKKASKN